MAKNVYILAKNFKEYTVDGMPANFVFLKSEDGSDWYELRSTFRQSTLKIAYDQNGVIVASGKNFNNPAQPDSFWPANLNVAEIKTEPKDFDNSFGSWVFNEETGKIARRAISEQEKKASADKEVTNKINEAMLLISPLSIAKELQDISDSELSKLKELQKYVVSLNRVKDQEGYPDNINWPTQPE